MAALAATAVSRYPTDLGASEMVTFGPGGVRLVIRRLRLALTGQGGQTNTIGAAALGFSFLVRCSNLFDDSNNLVYPAVVDPVANTIVLSDAALAPVDVTAAVTHITVEGY